MKFYITKYALTKGIIEAQGEITKTSCDMIELVDVNYEKCIFKPFWHLRLEDAIWHAETMRDRKLKSLAKQIERLENLKFYKD